MEKTLQNLADNLVAGQTIALARAISLFENDYLAGNEVHQAVRDKAGSADVVGITGPPGVGKSTLINALVAELRRTNRRVSVIAVDPSSPVSGGSILGDRARMGEHANDDGVFIRSVSSRGHLGGLSTSIFQIVDLVDAAGWDCIILETVGAGQSETEIADVADINVVVNAPGAGDDIQAIKSGILEIADVLVVNKADSPQVRQTVRQLKAMLQLRRKEHRQVPVLETVATDGTGIGALLETIDTILVTLPSPDRSHRLLDQSRRMLAEHAAQQVREQWMHDDHPHILSLLEDVIAGKCTPDQAIHDFQSRKDRGFEK